MKIFQLNAEINEIYDVDVLLQGGRIHKRYIRDVQNPIKFYNNKEFRRRYRFSKHVVQENLMIPIQQEYKFLFFKCALNYILIFFLCSLLVQILEVCRNQLYLE